MSRLHIAAAACLALASGGIVAGCGGDGNTGGANGSGTQATTPAITATAPSNAKGSKTTKTPKSKTGGANANEAPVAVAMKNTKFVPEAITAKAGQKIVWTNNDGFAHTVTADKGADFDSGTVAAGATYSYTPKKAGTIHYVCTIHPGQEGTITVTG